MSRPVLVLGGYGNFGKRIARALARKGLQVIVAGRSQSKAEHFAGQLQPEVPGIVIAHAFDVNTELAKWLAELRPAVVINTCGPFQAADYRVASICIEHGVHYIDLADGRDFVNGIGTLDSSARRNGVAVISGASTVPGLSSAVLEHFKSEFASYSSLRFGISPGQKAERGLATTEGILSYVGKPLRPFAGNRQLAYGWQDLYRQRYPELGWRWMANCDIPDLDLLPQHYGIQSVQFSAGLELGFMHLGLWLMSWLVRAGVPFQLSRYAQGLLTISNVFDRFGTAHGGMHMHIQGFNHAGDCYERSWFIVARDGHGPHIPTIPAIVLASKASLGPGLLPGARSCVGAVTLNEYLDELKSYEVRTYTR